MQVNKDEFTIEEVITSEVNMVIARLDSLFKRTHHLRYGQMFLNMGVSKNPWPELYHKTEVGVCREIIRQWLTDNQNWYTVNSKLDEIENKK